MIINRVSHKKIALFFGVLCAIVFTHGTQQTYAAYDGANLISNSILLNANSMNADQIQSFLVSKESGLATRSFVLNCYGSTSKERQAYTAIGAPCDQNIQASRIIYYAAQIYGINPQVIMSTLQKEQSLITTKNPTDWQINQAMGYGCPTSGNCAGSSTFSYQIDSGTWVLRYHYERANGNMNWWSKSTSWTCGTEKKYYKPNLYPNQDVRFYDENDVHYRTHHLANAATSSFYCYTPHAYNNPNGLYGRAAFGTTGLYYSGSYNFVYYFELWFGNTKGAPFSAQYVAQSPYPVISAGSAVSAYFHFKNTGTAFWKDDLSNFPGYRPVHMATTFPINRGSSFAAGNWLSSSRTTGFFSKVYEADGITLAPEQHTVQPGQIARFEFTIYANPNIPGGVYREHFQPILEGAPGYEWNMEGWAYLDIGVHRPNYKAAYHSQSAYPTIPRGGNADVFMQFVNTGNDPWFDDTSLPAGKQPIHLAGSWPINRWSNFSATWPSGSRPNLNFSKVYQADGVTLSSDQHTVQPGQIARFEFKLSAPINATPGFYQEHFQPIVESAPGQMWDMGISGWLGVNVVN